MRTWRGLERRWTRWEPLWPYLPWVTEEDGFFYLSDGGVGVGWRVGVWNVEGVPEAEVEDFYSRIAAALAALPRDGTFSGQTWVRVRGPEAGDLDFLPPSAEGAPEAAREFGERRRRFVLEGGKGFWEGEVFRTQVQEVFLFLVKRPPRRRGVPFLGRGGSLSPGEVERAARELAAVAGSFEVKLKTAHPRGGLSLERIGGEDLIRAVWGLLNPSSAGGPFYDPGVELRRLAAGESVVVAPHGVLFGDRWEGRVLSFRFLPGEVRPGMVGELAGCGVDFFFSVGFHVPPQEKEVALLKFKRAMLFIHRRTMLGDTSVEAREDKEEVDRVLESLHRGEEALVRAVLQVGLLTPGGGRGDVDATLSAMARLPGAAPYEERHVGGLAWFGGLPLVYDPSVEDLLQRDFVLTSGMLARFLPFSGKWRGGAGGRRVRGKPMLLLHNRVGEPAAFAPWDSSAPHTVVAATTGAGKSFLVNAFVLEVLRTGGRVFVIDVGGSYRRLCRLVGGQYVETGEGLGVNPFNVGELSDDVVTLLTQFVGMMACEGEVGKAERAVIGEAVRRAFEDKGWRVGRRGREVLLRDVKRALERSGFEEGRRMALSLGEYVGSGSAARWFDRPQSVDVGAPMVVFDLAGMGGGEDVKAAIVFCIFAAVNAQMQRLGPEVAKVLVVDEAWSLLKGETAAGFLETFSRTARKAGGCLVSISQSMADWTAAGIAGEVILQNSPNRLLLQQQAESLEVMRRRMGMREEVASLVGGVKTVRGRYSEVVVQAGEDVGVARYVPSPWEYWVFTTHPDDLARIEEVVGETGDELEAVKVLSGRGR